MNIRSDMSPAHSCAQTCLSQGLEMQSHTAPKTALMHADEEGGKPHGRPSRLQGLGPRLRDAQAELCVPSCTAAHSCWCLLARDPTGPSRARFRRSPKAPFHPPQTAMCLKASLLWVQPMSL